MALGHAVRAVIKDTHNTQHKEIIIAWPLEDGVHQEMMAAILMTRVTIIVTPGTPGEMGDLGGDLEGTLAGARGLVVTEVDRVVIRTHLVAGVMTLVTGGPELDHQVEEEMIQGTMMIICLRQHQAQRQLHFFWK